MLLLVAQQSSLFIPYLEAVPVGDVMIRAQRFGGFKRQFERFKCLRCMSEVSRHAKWSVQFVTLPRLSESSAPVGRWPHAVLPYQTIKFCGGVSREALTRKERA